MLNTQKKLAPLLLFLGIAVFSCRESKKDNLLSNNVIKNNKVDNHFEIVNTNKSFIGELNGNNVILNINSKIEEDTVFGALYYYNEVDPYESIKYFKGIIIKGKLKLENKDSKITGNIIESSFKGELSINGKVSSFNLIRNEDYSNGDIYVSDGDISKKISFSGLEGNEVCQGQLFKIGDFEKNNHNYLMYYFVFPSTGVYKARGNCGNGIESLIAILKYKNDVEKTEVEIIDMQSCYNATECLVGENNLDQNSLIEIWKVKKELKIKKVDLRKDLSQIIKINPDGDRIIDFIDLKN